MFSYAVLANSRLENCYSRFRRGRRRTCVNLASKCIYLNFVDDGVEMDVVALVAINILRTL